MAAFLIGDLGAPPRMLQQQSESMAANAPLDLSFYHRTETLLGRLTQMAQADQCGRRLTVENLHDEQDPSFQLPVFTFGDHATLTAQTPHRTAKVLLNFGAHGRELITSEVALRLARMLCGEAPSRFYGPPDRSRDRIAELLKVAVIKMVPVQVPSSRKLAETASDTCRRRRLNARGVDVNRNWNASWTDGEDYASSDQFRGPQPFSEPETRSLANLAAAWRPDIYVDVHSGETYLATPYASKLQGVSDRAHRAALRGVVQAVTRMMRDAHPDAIPAGGLPNGPASRRDTLHPDSHADPNSNPHPLPHPHPHAHPHPHPNGAAWVRSRTARRARASTTCTRSWASRAPSCSRSTAPTPSSAASASAACSGRPPTCSSSSTPTPPPPTPAPPLGPPPPRGPPLAPPLAPPPPPPRRRRG